MKFKSRIAYFMQGRYGVDQLGRITLMIALPFWILSLFTDMYLFRGIAIALIVICYFRILSKNSTKRYAENQRYLKSTYKLRHYLQLKRNHFIQLKTHHIYKCPTCKQKIRIP